MNPYTVYTNEKKNTYSNFFLSLPYPVPQRYSTLKYISYTVGILCAFFLLLSDYFQDKSSFINFFNILKYLGCFLLIQLLRYCPVLYGPSSAWKAHWRLHCMLRAEGTYLESVTLSSDFVTLNGYLKNEKFEYSLTDAERSKITLLKTGIILPVQSSYVCLPRGFFPDARTFQSVSEVLKP